MVLASPNDPLTGNDRALAAAAHIGGCYARTRALWRELEGQYATWPCRFGILYGPPVPAPDLFLVGINPGYDAAVVDDAEIDGWPDRNLYATAAWPLARRLRAMFAAAERADLLDRANGANLLFFKSTAIARDRARPGGYYWMANPAPTRQRLEVFCARELDGIVAVLAPRQLLALGLGAFDRLSPAAPIVSLHSPRGRRLAAVGERDGRVVLGIIHPTGAQVSAIDHVRIAAFLATHLA